MYQPAALFIGLRYMRGRAADRFGRFVSWLSTIGITLGVMALVTVLSVMNGFERELQNNILGLMPQAMISAQQGSVNPQQLPGKRHQVTGRHAHSAINDRRCGAAKRPQRRSWRDAGYRPDAKRSAHSLSR